MILWGINGIFNDDSITTHVYWIVNEKDKRKVDMKWIPSFF